MIPSPAESLILLDAATGTELSRRGLDTSAPLWSARAQAEHPDVVREIHREALMAGAGILTTCTFRTQERTLRRAGSGWGGRSDALNALAVRCAREAIAMTAAPTASADGWRATVEARVAGSIAPLEDCFRPDLVPPDAELRAEHARQARSLQAAGADLLLVETMGTRREAVAACEAGLATGLETWCSFTTSAPGRLLSGESLQEAVAAVEALGVGALLLNCVPAAEALDEVRALLDCGGGLGPVGIQPNIGHGRGGDGVGFRPELLLSPEAFADVLESCVREGATIVGGCCGTTAAHVAAFAGRQAQGLGQEGWE